MSSRTWRNRKEELKQKEQILLEDLNIKGSRTKKIALWSLGSGVAALVSYGIYRAFSTPPEKPKKKPSKKRVPKNSPIVDSAIENLAPTFGKWLVRQLK